MAFKEASNDLNEHLKALTGKTANNGLSEKTRQAAAIVSADASAYAKSAQNIAALAQADIASAEAQFSVFNEAFKKLKADQLKVNNLIASEMGESNKAADGSRAGHRQYHYLPPWLQQSFFFRCSQTTSIDAS